MIKLIAILAIAIGVLAFTGIISASEAGPSKMLQVRLGNLEAVGNIRRSYIRVDRLQRRNPDRHQGV